MIAKRKFTSSLTILVGLLLITIIFSLSIGYSHNGFRPILEVLTGSASRSTQLIITNIRLPRIIACLLGGSSLALSGMLLQTLTRNPLADSSILGINTGAGLVFTLTLGFLDISNPLIIFGLPFLAMIGGGLTILVVYLLALQKNHGISPVRLIVTGVGVSTMLSGIMVSMISTIDDFKVETIVQWLSGKITGDNWRTIVIMVPLLLISWGITYSRSRQLNIMNLNDQTALALGLNLSRERLLTLSLATALAAFSVILVGNITFIGLVAGHITRANLGNDHRLSLPASMLVGSIILLVADTIGRSLLVGTGIPTGIVVSVIGAPYFLYLMKKQTSLTH